MTDNEEYYLLGEIIDEGTLNFSWRWMKEKFEWTDEEYASCIINLFNRGVTNIYKYGKDNTFIDVEALDKGDLTDLDNLKRLNFAPTELAFHLYNNVSARLKI